VKRSTAIILSVLTLAIYSAYILSGTAEWLYQWSKTFAPYEIRQHLGISKRYLLQYGHTVFLFILLVLSRFIFNMPTAFPISKKWVGTIAKYSPAVFLFHFPILFFLAAITDYDRTSNLAQFLLLGSVLLLCILAARASFLLKPFFDRTQSRCMEYLVRRYPGTDLIAGGREPLKLDTVYSNFLNFVKAVSMGAIVLGHFSYEQFTIYQLPGFDGSAPRFAVPVFFMLSGYFLMLSIDRTPLSAPVLFFKRMWSLYYLIIPMLLIVPILDQIGYSTGPDIYQFKDYYVFERERGPLGTPIFLATWINSILYLNESWIYTLAGLSSMKGGIVAFSNDPYWFMCYLLPFTLIMIVWRMVRGLQRVVVLFLVFVIIGPPVLMLAPLFFAGGLAYKIHKTLDAQNEKPENREAVHS